MSNFVKLTVDNNSLVSNREISGPTGTFTYLSSNNATFVNLPTSSQTPTNPNQLITKAYADATYNSASGNLITNNNTWTGTNTFSQQVLANGGITVSTGYFQQLTTPSINNISLGIGSGNVSSNTSVGVNSLLNNTTGRTNTSVGVSSLESNTTGRSNTSVGVNSLGYNTIGNFNTSVGVSSLESNTSGSSNTSVGVSSLRKNTTGSSNTSVGESSLSSNTTGGNNTSVGKISLFSNTTGTSNTSVGDTSLISNTTGNFNTAIGNNAGSILISGSNNIIIGFNAQPSSSFVSNQITFGDNSISTLRCQVTTITSLSDARDKKDIVSLKEMSGIEFVSKLNPVDFVWNMRDGGKIDIAEQGFIAQDLQKVQEETNIHIPGLVYDANPERLEASYGRLIPIMVQATKDLKEESDLLKREIELLKQEIEILKK